MTLSRWRRIATGIAAGVIVLCAALLGSALRTDNAGVSVASDLRPAVVIPIEEYPAGDDGVIEVDTSNDSNTDNSAPEDSDSEDGDSDDTAEATDEATSTDQNDAGDPATDDSTDADEAASADANDTADDPDDEALTDPVQVAGDDDSAAAPATDDADQPADAPADEPAATNPAPATPAAPLTAPTDGLGTGGGVDDAECALDRLVIYAGARRSGVAGSIRAALAQAGFAAGCPAPVTVLASNCPLQFAGVLGAGSGYDPNTSYVAASPTVDRETMTAVMGTVGYAGSQIDILDFGFVNPDQPGEQWMAIFIPPSFDGWQTLANRAGLAPTAQSLCAPSGQLNG